MAQLRIKTVREGQHPSEVVVAVRTADGADEKLIVDSRSIRNGTLEIGYPVGQDHERFLVELPRESVRGLWRIWVKRESVIEEMAACQSHADGAIMSSSVTPCAAPSPNWTG